MQGSFKKSFVIQQMHEDDCHLQIRQQKNQNELTIRQCKNFFWRYIIISIIFVIQNSIIMNQLKCQLCFTQFLHPKMCPHCSEVFCEMCITDYLASKHFCPSCDNYIIDLVDCARLINEVKEKVMNRKASQKNENLCEQHSLPLDYFCKVCQRWICPDCGVIDSQHRNHRIVSKKEIISDNKDNIKQEITETEEEIKKIKRKKQQCRIDIEFYASQLKWCKNQIMDFVRNLLDQADLQTNLRIQEVESKIKDYDKKISKLENHQTYLNNLLESEGNPLKRKNVPVSDEEQMESLLVQKNLKLSVMDQFFPQFTSFTYEFDYQNLKNDLYHYSNFLELWGQDWRIKIYPKGNSAAEGKFISVFLQLTNGHLAEKAKKYCYRIELLNLNKAGQTIIKEYSSIFESGQCWGYTEYIGLDKIEDFLFQGRLFFSIGIRNETYGGFTNDLKKYISKIEKEKKILERLICESNYEKEKSNEEA